MKKIYSVEHFECPYEPSHSIGFFSSREEAQAVIDVILSTSRKYLEDIKVCDSCSLIEEWLSLTVSEDDNEPYPCNTCKFAIEPLTVLVREEGGIFISEEELYSSADSYFGIKTNTTEKAEEWMKEHNLD